VSPAIVFRQTGAEWRRDLMPQLHPNRSSAPSTFSGERMVLRAIYCLTFVLSCGIIGVAQKSTEFTSVPTRSTVSRARPFLDNEPHLQNETLGVLYANSAFAHGYRHGYEDGFHIGDFDLHMGHDSRALGKSKECQARRHYRESFGSRELFEQGYDVGVRKGYADATSGREFRATDRTKIAGAGLVDVLPQSRRAQFDQGFAAGYRSAQSQHALAVQVSPEYVEQYCRRTLAGSQSLEYCSGFGHGYVFGAFDLPPSATSIATSRTPAH
jgi:hypothetical protein